MRNRTLSEGRHQTGQALVEFTMIVPVLLLLVLGIIQFGVLFNNYIEVTNAARDGARKAAVSRTSPTGVSDSINAARDSVGVLNRANMNITVSPAQPWVAGQDVDVKVTYPASVDILGIVVWSGNLTAESIVRME